MMKDFPSCFGENGVQVADASSSSSSSLSTTTRASQNVVTCVYQCRLRGLSCLIISLSWSKNLMGQGFTVGIDELNNRQSLCKVDIKPWLFSKKKGSKIFDVESSRIHILWDLSSAKFGSGPEPLEGFYVAVLFNKEMVLLLGDLKKEACKKINRDYVHYVNEAIFIAKREHIFGVNNNNSEPCLVIRIDSKAVMQVKQLKWKFRGNHTILVDGFAVEVFWDLHNWLFGNAMGNAVFMFRTCISSTEKISSGKSSVSDPNVLSQQFRDSKLQGLEFSLILYAWKNE
ncbi:hypothetical protein PIB30_031902 [Stylosanthes scabra]|uniref:DUF868 domain-containing protein n=1 Tax=Stylosanthes scabra TaxID=79078 RepID=A0ABU6XAY1_9FABA|nr:hypothetical protein [Stylosanthes scabra]